MWRKFCLIILICGLMFCTWSSTARAAEQEVVVLNVEGAVVPVTDRYIGRGLSVAEETGAAACVIALNTPGGLYDTTQDIVQKIMSSKVPVIVYVSPAGGWAGSAGTFITMSAHVAAMAPGSRIGAAHPVGGQGQELSPVQNEKITEDAAAWARSIAETRGRNGEKAELAVRESKSYTDREALEYKLVDLRASNLDSLLEKVNGWEVTLDSGEKAVLNIAGADLNRVEMTFNEKFLDKASDPNIVYILLMLGMLGLVLELSSPGLIFPGVAGSISLLLSLYAAGTLDASWGGILLILLSFGLFIAEVFVPSLGLLSVGGAASLVIGSILLFSGNPGMQVSYGLIFTVVVCVTAIMVFVVQSIIKAHRNRVTTGLESIEGSKGVAITGLNPSGTVLFNGERWNAIAEGDTVEPGGEVVIVKVEGLKLHVRKAEDTQ